MPEFNRVVNIDEFKRNKKLEEQKERTFLALNVISTLIGQRKITPLGQNLLQKLIGQEAYSRHVLAMLDDMPLEERNRIVEDAKKKFLEVWKADPKNPDFEFTE